MASKQVEMSQCRLSRELDKLNGIVKSEIRMLSADRHRFQIKHKNLKPTRTTVGSKVKLAPTNNLFFRFLFFLFLYTYEEKRNKQIKNNDV